MPDSLFSSIDIQIYCKIIPDKLYSLCQQSSGQPSSAVLRGTRRSLSLQPGTERRIKHPHPAASTVRTPTRISVTAAGSDLLDDR